MEARTSDHSGEGGAQDSDLPREGSASDDRDTLLRLIVEQMPAVLWATDLDLRLTSSEGAGLTAMGARPGQYVGVTLFDFFNTKDPEFLPLAAHRKALLGQSVSFEVDWAGRTYASHCEPLRNPDNSIRGVIGVALDITRQKRNERELQKAASLMRATLDSTDVAILVVDERGKISNFNESFVQLWGIPEDIAKTRDEERMLAFLLDTVADPGDFAKHVMGLHARRDVETKGPVKLKSGRVLQRSSKPQRVDGKTVGTVLSFREGPA